MDRAVRPAARVGAPISAVMRARRRQPWLPYWRIMRVDHWIKTVFVLPGILVALTVAPERATPALLPRLLVGLLAIGIVASANYVLNEVLDAPYDREHPTKRQRPVAAGDVNVRLALVQWVAVAAAGVGLGIAVARPFAATLLVLLVAGTLYNLRPVRTKDILYLDVLTEALNNPLRMAAGWLLVGLPLVTIPVSLLLSYWMVGGYFMAVKRFAELRQIRDAIRVERYRRVLASYSERTLLTSIMFYASAAMLFFGAFIMRYRMELILSFPLVAGVMAVYLLIAFEPDSAVQAPEKLYREPLVVSAVTLCAAVMVILLVRDIPALHAIFQPTLPLSGPR